MNSVADSLFFVLIAIITDNLDEESGGYEFTLDRLEGVKQVLQSKGYDVNNIPQAVIDTMNAAILRATSFEAVDMELMPPQLMEALLPFQRIGVEFAIQRGGKALICDDMGLGKTIQGIAVASYYMQEWPVLILAQSSLKRVWRSEFIKWIPGIADHIRVIETAADFLGSSSSSSFAPSYSNTSTPSSKKPTNASSTKPNTSGVAQVTIMAYDLAAKLAADGTIERKLSGAKGTGGYFKVVVADESHMLKSAGAQRTKGLLPLLKRAKRALLLSGTPALSRPIELFPQLRALDASIWPTLKGFGLRYCNAHEGPYGWDYTGASNLVELNAILTNTIMIRRLKDAVLTDLPEKRRKIIQIEKDPMAAQLDPIIDGPQNADIKQRFMIMAEHENVAMNAAQDEGAEDPKAKGGQIPRAPKPTEPRFMKNDDEDILSLYREASVAKQESVRLYMRKLVEEENARPSSASSVSNLFASGPIDDLSWQQEQAKPTSNGRKFLVFAHHIGMLDAIADELGRLGVPYMRIDGDTSTKDREANVIKFQKEERCRAAVLSLTCASTGLTLTSGSLVIFAELYWNPGTLIQAEDRVHRLGQTAKFVELRYLFCKGTVDDLLWPLLEKKLSVVGSAINGAKDRLELHGAKKSKITAINKKAPKPEAALDLDSQDIIVLGEEEEEKQPKPKGSRSSKKEDKKPVAKKSSKKAPSLSFSESEPSDQPQTTTKSAPQGILAYLTAKKSLAANIPSITAPTPPVIILDDEDGISQDSFTPTFVGAERKRSLDTSLEQEQFSPPLKKTVSIELNIQALPSSPEFQDTAATPSSELSASFSVPSTPQKSSISGLNRGSSFIEDDIVDDFDTLHDTQQSNTSASPLQASKPPVAWTHTKFNFMAPQGGGVRLGAKKS